MRIRPLLLTALFCLLVAAPAGAAESLRLGLLPIVDTLALHVAAREGYFAEEGLDVTLVPFQSALEKDAAVQAGSLDAHFCEISSVIVQQAAGIPFKVVASTYYSNPGSRMFGLVTAPGLGANSLEDLRGKSIAIARQTIVDFMTDVFLSQSGLPLDFMPRKDIRKIPVRLQMLLAGQVDAALFPEPLLSIAEQAGGTVLMDDRVFSMPLAVIAFSEEKARPETVRAFQAAFRKAAAAINAELERWRGLMLELRLIPPQLAESFQIPVFDLALVPESLPSPELFGQYVDWLQRSGVLDADPTGSGLKAPDYADVVFNAGNAP